MLLLATVLAGLALAVGATTARPALAAQNAVVNDCFSHGKLTQTYTKAQLQQALAQMSSYVKQYSNCQSVIESALTSSGTGVKANGTGGGSSSSAPIALIAVIVVIAVAGFAGLLIARRRSLRRRSAMRHGGDADGTDGTDGDRG